MCVSSVCQRVPAQTRAWSDPQVYSHAALLPGIVIAACREPPMVELVVLQSIVFVLSLIWHRNREREDAFAKVEHFFAHVLFVYGMVQTWFSPSVWILLLHLVCAAMTIAVYVVTNKKREKWETWHPIGLHVVPGIWSVVIASYHKRLLF